MNKRAELTSGSVGRHLVRMSLPMMFGILATMAFNLADTWFVARLGTGHLAAISYTFPVVMVLVSFAIGLGAGTSSILARAIGEGSWPRVQRLTTNAMLLAFLTSSVLAIVGIATIDPLFRLLGADEQTLPLVHDYMLIWYLSSAFFVVPMVGMSAIRATGDTRIPSAMMIGGALINIILDPLFIFGWGVFPALGIAGAALASSVARVFMLVAALYIMSKRLNMLTFERQPWARRRIAIGEILHVGLPAAGTNAIIPIAVGIATALIASYGQDAVAGFGVASKVESVALISFYALSSVIGPFAGQNLGVGNKDRILHSLKLCAFYSLASGLLLTLLLALFAVPITEFFDSNPDVVKVARLYFFVVPISYAAAAMVMITNATFNGIGKPMPAVVMSVARMIGVFLPLAWLGMQFYGLVGIFAGLAIANVVCGSVGYLWLRRKILSLPGPVAGTT